MELDGPDKKERLLAALERGMVMIHLDARKPGVRVPESLSDELHLRLNLSYRFDPPDLCINDWGIRETLSFSGRRFPVAVPWSALFGITGQGDGAFTLFPADLPPEVIQQSLELARAQAQVHEAPPPSVGPSREGLQVVSSEPPPPHPVSRAESKRRGDRSHLRLVK